MGSSTPEAFVWTSTTGMVGLGFLPGQTASSASAVSANGNVIIGNSGDAVSWIGGNIVDLGAFTANAVNADGSVVVGTGTGAVRWTAATGTQSIQNILTADGVNLSGWELDNATGVSADGTVIVGNGNQPWKATIPVNAFALLDLKGVDHSIGSLVWGGTVTNTGPNPATLTAGIDNTSTAFIGIIQDGTSTTALDKAGTGTLTLTGTSTYSGGTILDRGTLDLAALGAAGAGPITFETGRQILQIENVALSANTFGDTIDSFGRGDAIDLKGLAFQIGATANYDANSHMLTVSSNGITDTLILTNPDGTAFKTLGDGASGTEIVLIPAVTESLKNDTGSSASDKITSIPTLTGSGDANAVVSFTVDGTPITATTTADNFGHWTFNPTGLSDGQHTVIASETDTAGNTGTASLTFTLDTAPPIPTITNEVLSQGKVTLTGTTAEANDTISVYDGSNLLGSVTTDSNGNWQFVTGRVSNTVHVYTVSATDLAGNVGQGTNEAILGSTKADALVGGPGNDVIVGNGGNDTFTGGGGADTLFGGPGHDNFVFKAVTDTTPASHDTIFNFNHSNDVIEFAGISGING